jgi:hypothetical protein
MGDAKPSVATVIVGDPRDKVGEFKSLGGSQADSFNTDLAAAVVRSLRLSDDASMRERQCKAVAAALTGIAPQSEIEGMLGAQMIAAHHAAMECFRRAMLSNQPTDVRSMNLSMANKASRTFAALLEGLNRHRGKGQQKVTVEHVHVHAGAQAVVGVVDAPGGGAQQKSQEPCHAKQLAHAPEPALPGPLAIGDALPVARDEGQEAVSHARREAPRRSTGKSARAANRVPHGRGDRPAPPVRGDLD